MPGNGKIIHSDEWFTRERLIELSQFTVKEALKIARCGKNRLEDLWQEADIKREVHKVGAPKRNKGTTNVLTDAYLEEVSNLPIREISDLTGFAQNTIRNLYLKRGIKHKLPPKIRDGRDKREYLSGTRPPINCHKNGCTKCKYDAVCQKLFKLNLPLMGEALTLDDSEWYVAAVKKIGQECTE